VSDGNAQFLGLELLDELDRTLYAPPSSEPAPLGELKRRMSSALIALGLT
jgi:hypothetical protein